MDISIAASADGDRLLSTMLRVYDFFATNSHD